MAEVIAGTVKSEDSKVVCGLELAITGADIEVLIQSGWPYPRYIAMRVRGVCSCLAGVAGSRQRRP